MVGVAGFEPTASWTRTKRATKLRYTPLEKYFQIVKIPITKDWDFDGGCPTRI